MKEARPTVVVASEPEAKEQLMLMMMVLLIMTVVVQLILFNLFEFAKFGVDLAAEVDFLGVDLVEHFDKGSIFRLNTTTKR